MSADDTDGMSADVSVSEPDATAPDPPLVRVRTEPRTHAVSLALAAGLGGVLASIHWLGLVAAGVAVAVVAPTVRRGVAYAVGVGMLALVAFAVSIGPSAALVPGMRPVVYVTVAGALGLPLFGSLARGIA